MVRSRFSGFGLLGVSLILACSTAGCGKSGTESQPSSLSYDDLARPLRTMDDLYASKPGTRQLHTSYDRKGGNDDCGFYVEKTPDKKIVVADFAGPGCVQRFWYTGYGGKFWFYFDDEKDPRLTTSAADFDGRKPFLPMPLAETLSGGTYSYVPIPFVRRLRVMADAEEGARVYYQFAWSKYAGGTAVPQFNPSDPALLGAVEKAAGFWKTNGFSTALPSQTWSGALAPWSAVTVFGDKGRGVLKSFWLRPRFPENTSLQDRNAALRDIVMRIFWSGSSFPSVDVPMGDFFCNAWRERRFTSAPLECTNGTFVCRFPMPFEKGVKVELVNEGKTQVSCEAGFGISREQVARPRYFHAEWRLSDPATRPHVVLDAKGKGHYVGCFLTVTGTEQSWMILEGDDQIFLDGEEKPSMHGTGLEDYFNAGWYYNNLFNRPFHGLIERTPFRTAQYRFHVPDPIDFKKGIHVQFEKGSENTAAGYMTSVAYWYQDKPARAAVLPGAAVRRSDADPMEFYSFMDALFELERIRHYDEAAILCDEFCEKYPQRREAGVVQLRKLAYLEKLHGFESVRTKYEQIAANPDAEIAGQARALLSYGTTPDLALLGVHTMGSYELYLNGKLLGRSKGGPVAMQVFGADMPPGEYLIAAKVPFEHHESWFSMYVKSHHTNLFSDVSWKYSHEPGEGWEQLGFDDSGWKQSTFKGRIPFLGCDYFVPNAFVDMQSPWHNIRPEDWNNTRKTAYIRKTIVIPAVIE